MMENGKDGQGVPRKAHQAQGKPINPTTHINTAVHCLFIVLIDFDWYIHKYSYLCTP